MNSAGGSEVVYTVLFISDSHSYCFCVQTLCCDYYLRFVVSQSMIDPQEVRCKVKSNSRDVLVGMQIMCMALGAESFQ